MNWRRLVQGCAWVATAGVLALPFTDAWAQFSIFGAVVVVSGVGAYTTRRWLEAA